MDESPSPTMNAMLSMVDVPSMLASSPNSASVASSLCTDTGSSSLLPNGKKTKGRVKIKMEYIGNKLRRYTTFSKRKTGIMKKAYELSTLTGTQVMLLVASETGHVYTFATKKLNPMISSEAGKALIQSCLNQPDEGSDLAPSRTEFTFDSGNATGTRKRKNNDVESCGSAGNFLPTMVPSTLFQTFQEEDYAEDSDASDSEEAVDEKVELNDEEKEKEKDISATLQQTLKEALRAAASNRQAAKRKKLAAAQPQPPSIHNSLLAPFLMAAAASLNSEGATASGSSNPTVIYQGPQGTVYSTDDEGGAAANNLFANAAKTAEDATAHASAQSILSSFPFGAFNLQQIMETAVMNTAKAE